MGCCRCYARSGSRGIRLATPLGTHVTAYVSNSSRTSWSAVSEPAFLAAVARDTTAAMAYRSMTQSATRSHTSCWLMMSFPCFIRMSRTACRKTARDRRFGNGQRDYQSTLLESPEDWELLGARLPCDTGRFNMGRDTYVSEQGGACLDVAGGAAESRVGP